MNLQRWLTLGLSALLIACVLTRAYWLAPLLEDDEGSGGTGTPPAIASAQATEAPVELDEALEATVAVTPTLDPVLQEIMESTGADSTGVSNTPFVILAGDFVSIDAMHQASGTASIYQVGETRFVLRLDPFSVTIGPDLHVLLSRPESPRTSTEALSGAVDLGQLSSNSAPQNFQIPPGTQLDTFKSVIIYSMTMNLVYTTAELEPVRGQ